MNDRRELMSKKLTYVSIALSVVTLVLIAVNFWVH